MTKYGWKDVSGRMHTFSNVNNAVNAARYYSKDHKVITSADEVGARIGCMTIINGKLHYITYPKLDVINKDTRKTEAIVSWDYIKEVR